MVLGIGIDAVSIERMSSQAIKEHVVHRLFHPAEVAQADALKEKARAQFLASRYAAKEALGKALGCGMCGLIPSEIEVVTDAQGRPSIRLAGRTAQYVQELAPDCRILLSLTHEPPLALAQVMLTVGESVPSGSFKGVCTTMQGNDVPAQKSCISLQDAEGVAHEGAAFSPESDAYGAGGSLSEPFAAGRGGRPADVVGKVPQGDV
jgi:holo-[acyl-carrier protein] synthase